MERVLHALVQVLWARPRARVAAHSCGLTATLHEGLTFSVQLRGGVLALREVMIFDHVQYGGLYDLEGRPGPLREPVRRMNRDFRSEPARCADPRFAGLRSP